MTETAGYCTLCRSRCGARHVIEDGTLRKVIPLATHPTGGALCAKGRAAPELLYSPQRLTHPMRRTNPRDAADPGWVDISWDEALDDIATRLLDLRAAHGAETVAFAVTTPSGTPMVDSIDWVERFIRCFGSPNMIYAIEVCGWHKDHAHKLTFGQGIGVPDWAQTELIVLWGHNPARTWLAQASQVADARRRGARVVVIDPKQDGSGQQADLWLRIRPGADGALALGAVRHLIETRRYDDAFVRSWTNAPFLVDCDTQRLLRGSEIWVDAAPDTVVLADDGDGLRRHDTRLMLDDPQKVDLHARRTIRDIRGRTRHVATAFALLGDAVHAYTPAHVAGLTWIGEANLHHFNALFENGPKASYYAWTGVGQHSNATATERAIGTLYALTGACDAPGGNLWTITPPAARVADYSLLAPEQQAKALGLDALPLGPPSQGWITARDFARAALQGDPYAVRALVSFGTNLLLTQSDSARNQAALQALDFHVHVDVFMNPTAQSADIVLPATLPWEREALKIGFEISQAAAEHVQLRTRMVEPLGQARHDYAIVMDLATRMGMADRFFGGDMDAAWNHQLKPIGLTVQMLRDAPEGIRVPQPFQYRKYALPRERPAGFSTPSRRVELFSEALGAIAQPPLAWFVEPASSPLRDTSDARYPLVLTTAKSGWFVHSSHRHVTSLRRKAVDPCVQLGAGLARSCGIDHDDWVSLSTPQGSVSLRARIDAKLDDRTVIADFGWWQGATAFDARDLPITGQGSANINAILTDAARDPISGSIPLRATVCRIDSDHVRNRGRWHGWRAFRLTARTEVAKEIVHFVFAPVDGGPLPDFHPGQHLTVREGETSITRAYSLVGPCRAPRTLSIAVKRDGRMSSHLHRLLPGAVVSLGAPAGHFRIPLRGSRPLILVGSGIGITPFIGYLEALAEQHDAQHPDIVLHYVCRDGRGHAFADRIRTLARRIARLRVVVWYRAPGAQDRCPDHYDRAGDLDISEGNREHGDDPLMLARRPLAYLCGSAGMLASTTAALVAKGLPAFDILSETFASESVVPADLAEQPITVVDTGETFVWHAAQGTLLDAGQAAGVGLPSGCRVGQCESCLVEVVQGRVMHLQPYDGAPSHCLTCQAVPLEPVVLKRLS